MMSDEIHGYETPGCAYCPSTVRACRQGVDAAWGIILQFPFYAGIFGLMQNTGLGRWRSPARPVSCRYIS